MLFRSANTAKLNGPTLYRVALETSSNNSYQQWGSPQPVANWVQSFTIELGVDTSDSGQTTVYKAPADLLATDVVVSARVNLSVLSEVNTAVEAAATGSLAAQNTATSSAATGSQRRAVTTRSQLVQLRNTK